MTSVLSWSSSVLGNGWLLGAILAGASLVLARMVAVPARARWLAVGACLVSLPALAIRAASGEGGVRVITDAGEVAPVLVAIVWAVGAILLGAREVRGHMQLRRMGQSGRPATDAERRRAGVDETVKLRVGESGRPMTLGFLRPTVYVPRRAFEELVPGAFRAVLRHELSHVRWRDSLTWAAFRLMRILFWPIAPLWLLERLADHESEVAADEAALDGAGSAQRRAFALALLEIATWEPDAVPAGSPARAIGGDLADRIRSIAEPAEGNRGKRGSWWAIVVLAALTATTLATVPRMKAGIGKADAERRVIRTVIIDTGVSRGS